MRTHALMVAGFMILGGTTSALADCASEIASLSSQGGAPSGGISKDGSVAPLQESAAGTAMPDSASDDASGPDSASGDAAGSAAASSDGEIAKDGSTMPLDGTGGASADTAMSQQDAQAQQQGGATAAATGDALERAQAALAAGDEAGCLEAIEAAKGQSG